MKSSDGSGEAGASTLALRGRISVISRKHGMDRCWNRGQIGFGQWVGWGVIANNLTALGRGLSP